MHFVIVFRIRFSVTLFFSSYIYKFTRFFIRSMFHSDEGPTLQTLDFAFHIGSTPTFLYFYFYLNTAYAGHYILCFSLTKGLRSKRQTLLSISAAHQPFISSICISTLPTQYTFECQTSLIFRFVLYYISTLRFYQYVCLLTGIRKANVFLNQFVLLLARQVPLMEQVFLVSGFQLDSDTHSFSAFRIKTNQY